MSNTGELAIQEMMDHIGQDTGQLMITGEFELVTKMEAEFTHLRETLALFEKKQFSKMEQVCSSSLKNLPATNSATAYLRALFTVQHGRAVALIGSDKHNLGQMKLGLDEMATALAQSVWTPNARIVFTDYRDALAKYYNHVREHGWPR